MSHIKLTLGLLFLWGVGDFSFWTAAWAGPAGRVYDIWQIENRWSLGPVTAVVQARDGYLWLGTYHGLVRYDGVRFTVFDPGNATNLQTGHITSLYVSPDGVLWIGHETGQLTSFAAEEFAPIHLGRNWRGAVEAITSDQQGDVWLLNELGELFRVRDGLGLTVPGGASPTRKAGLARGANGEVWVTANGAVARLEGGKLVPVPLPGASPADYYERVLPAHDGGLWVMGNGRLRKCVHGQWLPDLKAPPGALDAVTLLFEMRSGPLLVGTLRDGLYLLEPGMPALHFNRDNRLSHDWIRALCDDHEGNVWVGTGGGFDGLRPRKVQMLSPPDQWQGCSVRGFVVEPAGAAWIGTEGAGLYRYDNGHWSNFGQSSGLSNLFVWSVLETQSGGLYVGTWGGGLLEKSAERFETPPGLAGISNAVTALYRGRSGELWIGTRTGLFRSEQGKLTWFAGEGKLAVPDVRAITESLDGTLWFGMSGGGLGSLKGDQLTQYRQHDGLSSDFVVCLYSDTDGTLWIGSSDNGLTRLKNGKFAIISTSQGLPSGILSHIVDDGAGNLWFGSQTGIFRASKQDLNRCADGLAQAARCLSYGTAEGLLSPACAGGFQPGACRSQDGRLWFPTVKGLAIIDPANVTTNTAPPPVVLEEMLVDREEVPPGTLARLAAEGSDAGVAALKRPAAGASAVPSGSSFHADSVNASARRRAPLRIAPGRQRFEFRYTALSFMAPEKVHFRRKLEGLDPDWVDTTERVAQYSYLPPGTYTFRVTACNNDDFWNETGVAMTFTVLPRFWETWWFYVASIGSGAGALSGAAAWLMRQRVRRKLQDVERQRALERERARIARDIHDDLGASLTRISMLSQSARTEVENHPQAAADLDQIYHTARELTRAMDEIVWAVNPKHDTLDSLVTYLGRFAQHFLSAAGIRCRLDVPLHLPAGSLTAEVRHNVFLAFKEALNNVVKHAQATELRVSLELQPGGFVLLVADNGRGFDWNRLKVQTPTTADLLRLNPGNGVSNMQRRLEEIGGRCEWETAPGEGTRVKFIVSTGRHQNTRQHFSQV